MSVCLCDCVWYEIRRDIVYYIACMHESRAVAASYDQLRLQVEEASDH